MNQQQTVIGARFKYPTNTGIENEFSASSAVKRNETLIRNPYQYLESYRKISQKNRIKTKYIQITTTILVLSLLLNVISFSYTMYLRDKVTWHMSTYHSEDIEDARLLVKED